jgi:hypothetical protein
MARPLDGRNAGVRPATANNPAMTRRRTLALGLALLAAAPGAASWADGHSSHSAVVHAMTAPYTGNSGVQQYRVTAAPAGYQGFVTFKLPKSWSKLAHYQFDVVDQSGLPVLFEPVQNGKSLGTFCGKTNKPVKAKKAGAPITVYLYVGMCGSTPSVPSNGGIRVVGTK